LLPPTPYFLFGMSRKSFLAEFFALIFVLASTSFVYVQAAAVPALGAKGISAIGDIQRPSITVNADITQNLDASIAVMADAGGAFSLSIVNFNL
jgi:hypothetical protein